MILPPLGVPLDVLPRLHRQFPRDRAGTPEPDLDAQGLIPTFSVKATGMLKDTLTSWKKNSSGPV
jgi:hypothetical protein